MALNNSSSADAYEIFRELDWFPQNASLNQTRDDTESTRAATQGGTVELQQLAIPLTPQSSSMQSVSPSSVCSQAPVDMEASPVPPNDTNDRAPATQDPRDRIVK